jgi:hypothetical protein
VQPPRQIEQDLLQAPLHGGGERGVHDGELLARAQRRREVRQREVLDAVAADPIGVHQAPKILEVGRLPVGGHGHDLVLVRGAPEPEVRRELLVQQSERVRQRLRGQDLQPPAGEPAGERGADLAAAVEHEHRARVEPRGEGRRGGVRHVMRDPPEVALPAVEDRPQEQRRPLRVERPQSLPVRRGDIGADRRAQRRVIGVRDGVKVVSFQTGGAQAERDRLLGQLPGRERHRRLPVLAAREAFFLSGGHGFAVDDDRRGRIVKDGIDAQDVRHWRRPVREALRLKRTRSDH